MPDEPEPAKDTAGSAASRAPGREDKKRQTDEPIPSSTGMDILDVLFVLACSIMIVLLLFWFAGQFTGRPLMDQPPTWLSSLAQSAGKALSAFGVTVVLGIIRSMRGRKTQPKYLVYIFSTVALLLIGTLGIARLTPSPSTKNVSATLHFDTDYPAGAVAHFIEQSPDRRDNCYGEGENDRFSKRYHADATFPATSPPDFNALVTQTIPKNGSNEGARQGYSQMCLRARAPITSAAIDVVVECKGADCTFKQAEPDVVKECGEPVGKPTQASISLPVIYAAEKSVETSKPQEPVWNVPTLHTLETTPNSSGMGYTRFDVKLPPNPALNGYDELSYQVSVNGERVYFDGLPPEVLKETLHPESSNTVSFALENLNFSGRDNGFEHITLQFTFYGHNGTLSQEVNLKYVALRPAEETALSGNDLKGPYTSVKWSAAYKVPTQRNEYEVFMHSTPSPSNAMSLKARFEKQSFKMDGRSLVPVVRPPFRSPRYGVVAGVTQPSGQIQFTFTQSEANSVCEWVNAHVVRATGTSTPYLFNIYTNKQVPCAAKKS